MAVTAGGGCAFTVLLKKNKPNAKKDNNLSDAAFVLSCQLCRHVATNIPVGHGAATPTTIACMGHGKARRGGQRDLPR